MRTKLLCAVLSVLVFGLVSNTYADNGNKRPTYKPVTNTHKEGGILYSYVYNDIPGSTITARTAGQTFKLVNGSWSIPTNEAHYLRNIKMQAVLTNFSYESTIDLNKDPREQEGNKLYISHKLEINIQKNAQNIASCEFTYYYAGYLFKNSLKQDVAYTKSIMIDASSKKCSPGYDIAARDYYWLPDSLVIFKTGS